MEKVEVNIQVMLVMQTKVAKKYSAFIVHVQCMYVYAGFHFPLTTSKNFCLAFTTGLYCYFEMLNSANTVS